MYAENRVSEEYINGVSAFTRDAEEDILNKGWNICTVYALTARI